MNLQREFQEIYSKLKTSDLQRKETECHPAPLTNMEWKDITVGQFLDLYRLSITSSDDDITKAQRAICILYDKTEKEVDEMMLGEFNKLSADAARFLTRDIPGKPVKQIRVGKNRYNIIYNPKKLRHRQYVEIVSFGDKPIENMHYIMASLVEPVNWLGMRRRNEASEHERISQDMLNAPVVHVYHSCVFFCNLYVNSMLRIQDYLVEQTMKQNPQIKRTEVLRLLKLSTDVMAGFIPQKNLRTL